MVAISAEIRQHDSQKEGSRVLRNERYYGTVSRSFELPQDVDTEHASARFENGVLKLTLPKLQNRETQKLTSIWSLSTPGNSACT